MSPMRYKKAIYKGRIPSPSRYGSLLYGMLHGTTVKQTYDKETGITHTELSADISIPPIKHDIGGGLHLYLLTPPQ